MMRRVFIGLIVSLLVVIGCDKGSYGVQEDQAPDGPWHFFMSKSEVLQSETKTIRASLLSSLVDTLVSDGSYCGYEKVVSDGLKWYYPCRVDDESGAALDPEGNPVDWSLPGCFDRIDKDSKYALRAAANNSYSLVLSSPAVRMKRLVFENVEEGKKIIRYGFSVDRNQELFISEVIRGLDVAATWIDDKYVFPLFGPTLASASDTIFYDRRSKITVKVACGKLTSADLHSVHFENVMSSAYYIPTSKSYELPVMDGGFEDPLDYYTVNTYPTLDSGDKIIGDKLVVPDGEPDIHLEKSLDMSCEWDKETNLGRVVTAIADFPILSLNYSALVDDHYKYEGLIPEIIVHSGRDSLIRSTVSLPVDFEPMKSYTVIIYISTAYVFAELYVTDWVDGPTNDVTFGEAIKLDGESILITDWNDNGEQNGEISNMYNE